MLSRVGLADRAKEKAETFSGGMQRRLELAKGLLHHPSVLLLDEPTTGLDPGARRDLWQYLQILRDEERVTVLVTTHLMEEAERCDRLAIYANGNVVALGTPAELKSEIGGDVILLEADNAESLAQHIEQRFGLQPTVLDHQVRLEIENGHRFVTDVVEAFPGEIEGVSSTSQAWKMSSSAAPAIASGRMTSRARRNDTGDEEYRLINGDTYSDLTRTFDRCPS